MARQEQTLGNLEQKAGFKMAAAWRRRCFPESQDRRKEAKVRALSAFNNSNDTAATRSLLRVLIQKIAHPGLEERANILYGRARDATTGQLGDRRSPGLIRARIQSSNPPICTCTTFHYTERVRPAAGPKGINVALGVAAAMGFMGGFLYSYQKSSRTSSFCTMFMASLYAGYL